MVFDELVEKMNKTVKVCKICGRVLHYDAHLAWVHKYSGKIYSTYPREHPAVPAEPSKIDEVMEAKADLASRYNNSHANVELEDMIARCRHFDIFDHNVGAMACLNCGRIKTGGLHG